MKIMKSWLTYYNRSQNQVHEHFPARGLILHYVIIYPSHMINSERHVTKPDAGPTLTFCKDGILKPSLPPPVETVHFSPHMGIHAKAVKYSEFPSLFPPPLVKQLNIHYSRISNCFN